MGSPQIHTNHILKMNMKKRCNDSCKEHQKMIFLFYKVQITSLSSIFFVCNVYKNIKTDTLNTTLGHVFNFILCFHQTFEPNGFEYFFNYVNVLFSFEYLKSKLNRKKGKDLFCLFVRFTTLFFFGMQI